MDPNLLAGLLGAKGGGKGGGYDAGGGGNPLAGLLGGGNVWESPMVTNIAFHPTKIEAQHMDATSGPVRDGVFEVSGGDKVSYRLYVPSGEIKTVVYFWHGNAEVCTAVDHVKDIFHGCGAAVLSLDYRGYSWGTGQPSLSKLCGDAEACFAASNSVLENAGCAAAKRVVMGRSIGATCAVHIAAKRASKIHGLVIDSGLMSLKGLPMVAQMGPMVLGSPQAFNDLKEPFDTLGSLSAVSCPTLVMHGKRDEIVPFAQAVECHSKLPCQDKTFKEWETAGHNDVTLEYGKPWMAALTELLGKVAEFTEPFPAGALVEAHSLSVAEVNGSRGRVLGPKGERYVVDLGSTHGEKALKPANLTRLEEEILENPDDFQIGASVEAHSLSTAAFNGLRGKVLGPKGDRVRVDFPEGEKSLKPANLKLVKD